MVLTIFFPGACRDFSLGHACLPSSLFFVNFRRLQRSNTNLWSVLREFYHDCIFFDGLAVCLTMLYTARKYISDRCYNDTIMSTLFVTQYCHVIFTGEEWWCLKVHVVHRETLYTRPKSFFKADLSTNTTCCHRFSGQIMEDYNGFNLGRWLYFAYTTSGS